MPPTHDPEDAVIRMQTEAASLALRAVEADTATVRTTDVIPLYEETARIEKRVVEGETVFVRKTVQLRDEVVETELRHETVEVERVRLDRIVETAPGIREEGDVMIVPVVEEVLVVEKRLILREEIRIRRTQQMQPTQQTVRLRREEASVERAAPATPTPPKET